MASYFDVLFFSLIGGVLSLVGGLLLLRNKKSAKLLAKYATPFAAGALLGAAFFELIPEAIEKTVEGEASRWILGGILLFFLLEHFLRWFHHHHEHGTEGTAQAPLIIIGDSIHNLLDGVAIGAAFLINAPTGIVTALAVAAHEIPQEIGDFGLLLKYGYSRKKVLFINVITALMSTLGALVTFRLGNQASLPLGQLLALTAGMFIYIAASDIIPTIHESSKGKANYIAAILLLSGVLTVGIATELAHEHLEPHTPEHSCVTYYSTDGSRVIHEECIE
jgi:zinc and cadmium transporter